MTALPVPAKRVPITRQALQHITDWMACYYCDGDELATLLDGLEGMAEGSAYSEYGSIDFADVAATVRDEVADFETPHLCANCNGSGEGQYDGTRCYRCHGKGELPSPKQTRAAEFFIPQEVRNFAAGIDAANPLETV